MGVVRSFIGFKREVVVGGGLVEVFLEVEIGEVRFIGFYVVVYVRKFEFFLKWF